MSKGKNSVKRRNLKPYSGNLTKTISRIGGFRKFKLNGYDDYRMFIYNVCLFPDIIPISDHLWIPINRFDSDSYDLSSTVLIEGRVEPYLRRNGQFSYGIPSPKSIELVEIPPTSLTYKEKRAIVNKEIKQFPSVSTHCTSSTLQEFDAPEYILRQLYTPLMDYEQNKSLICSSATY